MAVKMMQREVTSTKVKFATIEVVDGSPQAIECEKTFVGNVDEEKAKKLLTKEWVSGVTVLSVEVETQKYEMPVDEFIQIATKIEA